MNPALRTLALVLLPATIMASAAVHAQTVPPAPPRDLPTLASAEAAQVADILAITPSLHALRELQSRRSCSAPPGPEEVALRLALLEIETMAAFDVDSVLSEIEAERGRLTDVRTSLQVRRDRTASLLNAAALITGSGIGIAVNATQLSDSTAIAGDYVGIGSGVASVLLSVLAVKQKTGGPKASVGTVPNMLAPLLGREARLNASYPPVVLQYLESVPPGQEPGRGTRLEQLKASWIAARTIDGSGSAKDIGKVGALTSSADATAKLSIADINDRINMVTDVQGRVTLMKRDIASLMHLQHDVPASCTP